MAGTMPRAETINLPTIMKTLHDGDLSEVVGGMPTKDSSLAYDLFYGLGAIAGTAWSLLTAPMPDGWHRGFNSGYG